MLASVVSFDAVIGSLKKDVLDRSEAVSRAECFSRRCLHHSFTEKDLDHIYTLLQSQPFLSDWSPAARRDLGAIAGCLTINANTPIFR